MPIVFFLLGIVIGSFINALVYRLSEGITLSGRSFCPLCKKKIFWYDNIPLVSFFFLKGRCRHCREKISSLYPAGEFLTGLVFAGVGHLFFSLPDPATWLETLYLLMLFLFLIAIALYDFSHMEIPLVLVGVSAVLALLYLGYASFGMTVGWGHPLISGLTGGLALGFFFFLLVFLSKETWMGWGDVWLGFLGGLIVGLPQVLFLLTLSSFLGAGAGIMGILLGRKKMKSAMPFAPFFVIGIICVVFMKEAGFRFPSVLFSLIS